MLAKFDGLCFFCEGVIRRGCDILWHKVDDRVRWGHRECVLAAVEKERAEPSRRARLDELMAVRVRPNGDGTWSRPNQGEG